MRTFALIEDERATMIHIRPGGDVTVFDAGRALHCRVELDGAESKWRLLWKVMTAVAHADHVMGRIEIVADRCRTGWRPTPDEIDPEVPQWRLIEWGWAVDALAYPETEGFYSPATRLMGRQENGGLNASGEILWIDAEQSFAVCDDGFWWLSL